MLARFIARKGASFLAAAFIVILPIVAQTASAAVTFYGTRSDWNAAVGANTGIDFEGLEPPGAYSGIPVPPGLTLSGVNFSTTAPTAGNDFILAGPVSYGPSSVLALIDLTIARTLVIKFPGAGFEGIAFDLGHAVFPGNVTIQLSTGESFVAVASFPPTFVGFTSSAPIKEVAITEASGTDVLLLDNVSFALPVTAPLPTTTPIPTLQNWALASLGLMLLIIGGLSMRRRKKP